MLKRVEIAELEMGMFVHKMLGGWFDHPFWRSKFLIEEADKLQTLKQSALEAVIIDTAKGKDVAASAPEGRARSGASGQGAAAQPAGRVSTLKKRKSVSQPPPAPTTTAQELQAAEGIASRAKESMHKTFLAARLGKALNVRTVEPVIRDIHTSIQRNPQAFSGLMRCKLQNELVYRHALAVSALMVSLARKMRLTEGEIHQAGIAGLFLDIGTNYLPKDAVPADGDCRNADPKIWQQHVMLGYRALQNDDSLPEIVLNASLQHHERIDGTGYPKGLAGEEIGQYARMAAICDTFDFMLTETEKEAALDPAAAIRKLQAMEGAFDEDILRSFIESVGLYPVGSFVRLRSDRLAMVIDEDVKDSTKPIVQVFYSLASNQRITPQRIALAESMEEDEIVDIADLTGLDLPPDRQLRELIFLAAHKTDY
ncbi:HD-GYP domain-containing protein [Alteraurantiacibacter aquimixticola]|uniref:DUF3391 domain-containing protein n=1 Tax=Alteraurantiacibacter aquimixticola TaxID=2489173 RepID=A0A4T3EYM3_9SPHN|nr:DUF3391 domain-containing protein [Alteraurantiacibacter aquimixticola]TIX49758.1 DUF3391 domain-containing protein [Alteraurantiacibacter aquimixticola]